MAVRCLIDVREGLEWAKAMAVWVLIITLVVGLHFLGVHYRTPLGCDFCHQSHVRLELSSRLRLENFEAIVGLFLVNFFTVRSSALLLARRRLFSEPSLWKEPPPLCSRAKNQRSHYYA